MSNKLYGPELLAYVSENQGLAEKELVVGAGYFTELPDGAQQVNTKPFYQELAMASGLVAPKSVGKASAGGRRGKGLSYNLKTNINSGNAVLTGGYLEQIGVKPGERVAVEVIAEAGELVLKRAEGQGEACEAPTGVALPEEDVAPADAALAAALS